ncbi:MAG: hypothetical protein M3437_16250 [Chloroflexota bacterium]|nr:hypothetical protein [Chloroflexota bacterium]MDQ5867676.1 hypothetical protein [Chloroflexota bacterium]
MLGSNDNLSPYRLAVPNSDPASPRTLDEARLSRDNFVILQGSQPGQVYLTCQAVLVVCWEPVLKLLLRDLDAIAAPRRTTHARIRYEPMSTYVMREIGTNQESGLWIHEDFRLIGLDRYIRGILKGRLGRLPLSERLRYTALNKAKYGAQLALDRVLG